MAILIKDVAIPKTCFECPCVHERINNAPPYCSITQSDVDWNRSSQNKRNIDCPMTEIVERTSYPEIPFRYAVADYVLRKEGC